MTPDQHKARLSSLERAMRLMQTAEGILHRYGLDAQEAHLRELRAEFHVEHHLLALAWFNEHKDILIDEDVEVEFVQRVGIFKDGH